MPYIYPINGKVREISQNKLRCRSYTEYYTFKKEVLARDNYKCVCCGKNYDLKVHHLDGYDKFPKKRLDPSNAVTLCKNCHKNFHLIYGRGNNTKEQFEEWFGSVKNIVSKDIPNLNESRGVYCYETNTHYKSSIDFLCSMNIKLSSKKAVINSCNLKGNSFSVNGYHLIWSDIANQLNEEQKIDYILNNLDNPRRPFVLDLQTGFVFSNGHTIANWYGLKHKTINYYTRKYNTIESIIKHNTPCILYKNFANLNSEEQKMLLKNQKIQFYKEK